MVAHPNAALFANLPRTGPILAPRLLAAFGTDRNRDPTAANLPQYGGVAPVRVRSGRQVWTHRRWHAPRFRRQTIVEWADQAVPGCAWAKAYYRQQQQAGNRHQTILRSLARTWLRILWRCWHDRIPFDEAHCLAALRHQPSPLAGLLNAA